MFYFTYRPQTDGMGGQYQRIVGIIALANYYGAEYVHTPITEMEHIGDKSYLPVIENYFRIKDHWKPVTAYQYDEVYQMDEVDETMILKLKQKYHPQKNHKNILVNIFLPRRIIDRRPELYLPIQSTLRSIKEQRLLPFYDEHKTNIAIHIRRGDVSQSENAFRYTSIDYFKRVVEYFLKNVQNPNICIFTEITEANKNEFHEFQEKQYPNTRIMADADVITTFDHLTQANILVMCKSSFSYLAGLYNPNQVIYVDNFWHAPLPNWLSPIKP